jgi:mono/diheme cytochrome c family protein
MHRGARFLLQSALVGGVFLGAVTLPVFWGRDIATAQSAAAQNPHLSFDTDIAPVFNKYCIGCHAGAQPKGDMLLKFKDEADARGRAANDDFWSKVSTELSAGRMPPAMVKNRPSDEERKRLVEWINNDVLTKAGQPDPGPLVFHRLNNREYANTIRQLLYLPASYDPTVDFPADERGDGFDNNSDTLTISPVLIEHYLASAEKAVSRAFAPRKDAKDQTLSVISPLNEPSKDFQADFANRQAKIRINIEAFLPRAWRRPVTKEEVDGVMKFAALSFANDGESQDKATGLAIRAALLSPNFLFRLEQDPHPDGTGKVYALTEYQLASRLSYFLWSRMPDDALFAEAKAGTLRQNLDAEIKRMLRDPKAISLTQDFMGQWLEVRGLEGTPNLDKTLAASMKGETEHFFDYIVANNRPITDLLDADYAFVDERLAKLYGIPGVTGDEFRKVQLDPAQRFGLITQASILTLTSKPLGTGLRTSPVVRGKFILENLFNQKIPPPPPNVPPLAVDDTHPLTGTTRQIFEQHRANPVCAGCHARMEPYGFALENYAGNGSWRTQENNIPIDASGEINGLKFTTPAEFRQVLATRKDDFRKAVVRKVLSYALGRGIQGYDRQAIEQIAASVKQDGDTFNSVILNVVKSFPFQNARGSVAVASAANVNSKPKAGLQPIGLSAGGISK